MSDDFRKRAATAADEALQHPLVVGVMAELRSNLGVSDDGLPAYGIAKVAHYAAQVALAVALDVDPNLLRMSPSEARSVQLKLAADARRGPQTSLFMESGNPPRHRTSGGLAEHTRAIEEGWDD